MGGLYVPQVMITMAGGRKLPGVRIAWFRKGTKVEAMVKGYCSQLCGLRGQRREDGCVLARPDPT